MTTTPTGGLTESLTSQLRDPRAMPTVIEYLYDQDWSDGLPLVPATREGVDAFLATTNRDPGEVIGRLERLDREVNVELAAINALMAGCRPEYFPVVLAAWDSLMKDHVATRGAFQSTAGPAPLLIVNGPIRQQLGINSQGGAFGPGFRANATIARSLGLMVRNALGVRPQVFEQSTQGTPGRWSICLGENEEESPWEPMSNELGAPSGSSTVTATFVRSVEFVDNRHSNKVEHVLHDLADTMSRTGSWVFGTSAIAVVLNPEHARMLHAAGMTRQEVREWLFEHSGRSGHLLARSGKDEVTSSRARGPSGTDGRPGFQRVLEASSVENLLIAVSGAPNAGISMVCKIMSKWSGTTTPIEGT
ncbi:hypothetical protein [Citricoccus sp. K5]|uniref:hypothetical protein n=1 Tax=Citricoccus sp. K5 TaxID=2653135 RepID=UPI0012F12CCC|nr:hypothetical protein [Citricoccus sp. K5]VXB90105.1 conserved hypothetical protein [Citricoccus sp. K5]